MSALNHSVNVVCVYESRKGNWVTCLPILVFVSPKNNTAFYSPLEVNLLFRGPCLLDTRRHSRSFSRTCPSMSRSSKWARGTACRTRSPTCRQLSRWSSSNGWRQRGSPWLRRPASCRPSGSRRWVPSLVAFCSCGDFVWSLLLFFGLRCGISDKVLAASKRLLFSYSSFRLITLQRLVWM